MPLAWINGTRKQKEGYQAHYTEKDNNGDWGDDGDLGTTSVTMLMTLATTMVTMTAMMPTMMMLTMTAGLTDGPLSGQWVRRAAGPPTRFPSPPPLLPWRPNYKQDAREVHLRDGDHQFGTSRPDVDLRHLQNLQAPPKKGHGFSFPGRGEERAGLVCENSGYRTFRNPGYIELSLGCFWTTQIIP